MGRVENGVRLFRSCWIPGSQTPLEMYLKTASGLPAELAQLLAHDSDIPGASQVPSIETSETQHFWASVRLVQGCLFMCMLLPSVPVPGNDSLSFP